MPFIFRRISSIRFLIDHRWPLRRRDISGYYCCYFSIHVRNQFLNDVDNLLLPSGQQRHLQKEQRGGKKSFLKTIQNK